MLYALCFFACLPAFLSGTWDFIIWILFHDDPNHQPPRQTPGDDLIGRVNA